MKNVTFIGIDVGNSDTKSQNTVFPSGYEGPFPSKPLMSEHYLFFDGKYYAPSADSMFYQKDKTTDERGIVLTLISIAKELICTYSKKEDGDKERIQERITATTQIALGAGLPVSHYKQTYVDNLIKYYTKYMGDGIEFEYDGYKFSFRMVLCKIYPQGGAAAACKENKITSIFNTYYVVDIGGYTVDVAQFQNGRPSKDCFSPELGVIIMFDRIAEKVNIDYDIMIDTDIIKTVLTGGTTILKEEVQDLIIAMAQKHANDIINALRQRKIMFDSHPVLFVGGGAILLKKYILDNPLIKKEATQFIMDSKANAKGYKRLVYADYQALAAQS